MGRPCPRVNLMAVNVVRCGVGVSSELRAGAVSLGDSLEVSVLLWGWGGGLASVSRVAKGSSCALHHS